MNCRSLVVVVVLGRCRWLRRARMPKGRLPLRAKRRTLRCGSCSRRSPRRPRRRLPKRRPMRTGCTKPCCAGTVSPRAAPPSTVWSRSQARKRSGKRATQERIRQMFWRPPFSDDNRLVPVRARDRALLAAYSQKPRRTAAYGGSDAGGLSPARRARVGARGGRDGPRRGGTHSRACGIGDVDRSRGMLPRRGSPPATRSPKRVHLGQRVATPGIVRCRRSRRWLRSRRRPRPHRFRRRCRRRPSRLGRRAAPAGSSSPRWSLPRRPLGVVKPERHARASTRPARSR